LRIKGFASVEAIVRFLGPGTDPAVVDAVVAGLADGGLVVFRAGRLDAWALTPAGRTAHAERLAGEGRSGDPALGDVHRRFVVLNTTFKQLCTDWQLEGRSRDRLRRFDAVHAGATALVGDAAAVLDRLAPYDPRLTDAHRRVLDGDDAALTRPLAESYHDVWMELHEDLLVTLALARGAADGA
jgi:hypothetical protein